MLDDLLTTERLLFALLAFCMGARIIRGTFNGRSFSLRGDEEGLEEDADA